MIDLLAAVQQCADVPVPEASEQAMSYYRSGNLLWIAQWAFSLAAPWLFLATGFSAKLESFARSCGKRWFFSLVIYLVLFIALYQLLSFPLDFYGGYVTEHAYGLSTQSFGRWVGNWGKSTMVAVVGAAAFVWIFYLLLKKSPRRWWLYGTFASIAIGFFMSFVQPIWIDPLFNHFGPMKDKVLEEKILALASRAGIHDSRIFEVDKSQDTKLGNAYVTGLGSSKRIVLWDTLIAQEDTDEIMFTMGHEMGHYVLKHVWWSMVYIAVSSFAVFYLTYRAGNYLAAKFHKRFGFKTLSDFASVPLLLFLVSFFMLLLTPLSNAVSRHFEREADRFGLEITENNQAAAQLFANFVQGNLANPRPGPIYKFWRSSHPPLAERIDFCNSYCPWKRDEPMKYSKYFTPSP